MGALRRESIKCCSILATSDNCLAEIPGKWPFRYSRCFFYEKLIRLFKRDDIHQFGKRGGTYRAVPELPTPPKALTNVSPVPPSKMTNILPFCLCESLSYHFIKVVTFYSQSPKNNEMLDRHSQGFIKRNSSTGRNMDPFIFKRLRPRFSAPSKVA